MDLKLAFGIVLKKRRKEVNISQEQLALKSGLDRTFVSKLERGLNQPSLETIFAISEYLECSASELVKRVEAEH